MFLGHYRRLCGLTPDPQGVRAKAAMVCSCHATCGPAGMAVTVILLDLPTLAIMPRQKLNGKSDGWKTTGRGWGGREEGQLDFTHRTSFLRAIRQDRLVAAVFNGAVPPIKAFSC